MVILVKTFQTLIVKDSQGNNLTHKEILEKLSFKPLSSKTVREMSRVGKLKPKAKHKSFKPLSSKTVMEINIQPLYNVMFKRVSNPYRQRQSGK